MNLLALHPKLVHFPIAFIIGALVLQLIRVCLKKEALGVTVHALIIMAAVMSLLSLLSGLWEEKRLSLHHPVLEKHELFAYLTTCCLWLNVVLIWLLAKKEQILTIVVTGMLIILTVLVSMTAHYGGVMVYEYGVGVAL